MGSPVSVGDNITHTIDLTAKNEISVPVEITITEPGLWEIRATARGRSSETNIGGYASIFFTAAVDKSSPGWPPATPNKPIQGKPGDIPGIPGSEPTGPVPTTPKPPALRPDGSLIYPDGRIVYPDGRTVLPK